MAQGHPVTLIAPKDKYTEKLTSQDVGFVELKSLDRDTTSLSENYKLFKECKAIYENVKPDLILHYTSKPIIFGGRAAHQLKIPAVAVITGLGYAFIRKGWLQLITSILYGRAAKYHRKFIFENEDDLALFNKRFLKSDQGIAIKGCGVDAEYFTPIESAEKRQETQFTFIGRLLKDKGIREFVDAAKILKEVEEVSFRIVGELDEENPSQISKTQLVDWINEDLISYYDFKEDIRPEIAKASCVVLPSYREGMPRTILEAMAMAKPVIVSNVPGCRETVQEGVNGFQCKVKSAKDLANTMRRFMNLNDKEKETMGKAGRTMIEDRFTAKKIAKQIYSIIQ